MRSVLEKHSVRRTSRLIRVRRLMCLLSIFGYLLKAGQLEYDCRYSKMHGMPVTGGRSFRSLKPLWYKGVPP